MIFAFVPSASTRIYPIWEDKSLLFAKEASVKTSSCKDSLFSYIKRSPLAAFSICH